MEESYELQLAREGEDQCAITDDQWIAREENLALASTLEAKRSLVEGDSGRIMPDASYRISMCILLEVQHLLDKNIPEATQHAEKLLQEKENTLSMSVEELSRSRWSRKSKRIKLRHTLLALEIAYRLKKDKEEILKWSQSLAAEMNLSLYDQAPLDVDLDNDKSQSLPSVLDEEQMSTEYLVKKALDSIALDPDAVQTMWHCLTDMSEYARTLMFGQLYHGVMDDIPDNIRSKILELFLTDFSFEFTEVDGYLDLIIEDYKKTPRDTRVFKSHTRLSLKQLHSLLEREPTLFRDDVEFALYAIQLMQAQDQVDVDNGLDFNDRQQYQLKMETIERYLLFLSHFSSRCNVIRVSFLHEQLQLLRFMNSPSMLQHKLIEYLKLPRFKVSEYVNEEYVKNAYAEELIVFDSVSTGRNRNICKTMVVEKVGDVLGRKRVTVEDDEQLIKDVLCILWTSHIMSSGDEAIVKKYLSPAFVARHKVICMVKTCTVEGTELSEWIQQLPEKGRELSRWSSNTDITFCPSNPSYFDPHDEMIVHVNVRNVKMLTVQVYEIRTVDYFQEVKGNINLDGLLPNEEKIVNLSHLSPWQEARIPINLSSRSGRRGVYVVEVFEKDITCRALLRKGFLRHVEQVTSRGHEFTVLDEHGLIIKNASIKLMKIQNGNNRAHSPHVYLPESTETGCIVIPFRQAGQGSSDRFAIMFCHENFGFLHSSFQYLEEDYVLKAQMYIDSEQLRPGEQAVVLVHPIVTIAGRHDSKPVGPSTVVDVKMTIKFSSVNAESTASSVTQSIVLEYSTMKEFMNASCSFEIPMDAAAVHLNLSGRVLPNSMVSCEQTFQVQHLTQFSDTFTPHFVRRRVPDTSDKLEYFIAVLGHNGEPIRGKQMSFDMSLIHFENTYSVTLETDDHGEITLGSLNQVIEIEASFEGDDRVWSWKMPNLSTYRPQMVYSWLGERIEIILPYAFVQHWNQWNASGLLSVCRTLSNTGAEPTLEDVTPASSLKVECNDQGQPTSVSFVPPSSGNFLLLIRTMNLKYPVRVSKKQTTLPSFKHGILVEKKKLLVATAPRHLSISSHKVKDVNGVKILEVNLVNANHSTTQIWVICKRFLDTSKPSHFEGTIEKMEYQADRHVFYSILFENEYLSKRKMSDEYTYILQRRAFLQSNPSSLTLLGSSSLPKPTLIQNPCIVDESDMEELIMRKGDQVTGFNSNRSRRLEHLVASSNDLSCAYEEDRRIPPCGKIAYKKARRIPPGKKIAYKKAGCSESSEEPREISSISFLKHASVVQKMICMSDGMNRVIGSLPLEGCRFFEDPENTVFEVTILAFDSEQDEATSRQVQIDWREKVESQTLHVPKRSVCLSKEEALEANTPSLQIQKHECLRAGESRIFVRTFSSKYAVYETLASTLDLWTTLCNDASLMDLVKHLKKWCSTMTIKEKLGVYYTDASDDLNMFIYHKDRAFFNTYIKPTLMTKFSKTLIDVYLIQDDQTMRKRYLSPGVFQKMSVIEKLLVAECLESVSDAERICEHVIDEIESHLAPDTQLSRIFDTVLSQGAIKPDEKISVDFQTLNPPPPPAPQRGAPLGGYTVLTSAPPMSASAGGGHGFPFGSSTMAGGISPGFGFPVAPSTVAPAPTDEFELISSTSDDDDGVKSLDSDGEESDTQNDSRTEHKKKEKRKAKPYILPRKVRHVQEKRFFGIQKPCLDGRNMFWKDYAQHLKLKKNGSIDPSTPFLSSYFPETLRSLNEGLLALSVLDLGLDVTPTSAQQVVGGSRVELKASTNIVLYHQGIGPGEVIGSPNTVVSVQQKIVAFSDKQKLLSSDFLEIPRLQELIVNRIYTCLVQVSNIGSKHLKNINLLVQIPQGSIPLTASGFYTKNQVIDIAPHDTRQYTFEFYFPKAGIFEQYPAHVALHGRVIGWVTDGVTRLHILSKATAVNMTSWNDVATRGSLKDVLTFMSKEKNLQKLGLHLLMWRCANEAFYTGLVNYFRQRWVFNKGIWKYSLQHGDQQGIRELCSSVEMFGQEIGYGVNTSIYSQYELYRSERFFDTFSFDHTEFGPFLLRRAHRVSRNTDLSTSPTEPPRILNKKARDYYRVLCGILAFHLPLSNEHLLSITYFMILFSRISDAFKVFERLELKEVHGQSEFMVAYDYIDSYLDFFREPKDFSSQAFVVARQNVAKYKKIAHDRWQERFSLMAEVVNEYDEMMKNQHPIVSNTTINPDVTPTSRVANDIQLDVNIVDNVIHITSHNVGVCNISFYRIDVELLFSSKPFDSFSATANTRSNLTLVEPWKQMRVKLSSDPNTPITEVPIPLDLVSTQMLIRVEEVVDTRTIQSVTPPMDLTRSYFNSQLDVIVTQQGGVLQVLFKGRPVSRCYIKAYVKISKSNKAVFYKDGYTDVLGKFEYAAINGDLLADVEKFSVLISHPTHGTSVVQVSPPVLATTSSDFQDREKEKSLWY